MREPTRPASPVTPTITLGSALSPRRLRSFCNYEKADEQADGYENSVGAESDGADVNEGEHFCGSLLYTVPENRPDEGL